MNPFQLWVLLTVISRAGQELSTAGHGREHWRESLERSLVFPRLFSVRRRAQDLYGKTCVKLFVVVFKGHGIYADWVNLTQAPSRTGKRKKTWKAVSVNHWDHGSPLRLPFLNAHNNKLSWRQITCHHLPRFNSALSDLVPQWWWEEFAKKENQTISTPPSPSLANS